MTAKRWRGGPWNCSRAQCQSCGLPPPPGRCPWKLAGVAGETVVSRLETVACPSQCSCQGTDVHCHERRLASVPAGIPTTTQILRLYINQITKLEPGVFDGLTALVFLDLRGNQLQALPEGVFDRLVNLQRLWLNNNQLTSLPTGVFDKLTQLTHIVLSTNQLRNVPQRDLERLGDAKQSRINADQLKSIPRGAFDNLKSLTHIWLFDNPWDFCLSESRSHVTRTLQGKRVFVCSKL
ncbi:uncharacterized protein LOC144942493 [Lampetra fluviatilis]